MMMTCFSMYYTRSKVHRKTYHNYCHYYSPEAIETNVCLECEKEIIIDDYVKHKLCTNDKQFFSDFRCTFIII